MAPQNAPEIDEEYMDRIVTIVTEGLKFGRCAGCDPTPWTVSGAATFRTGSKDKNGNNINVGCLFRVEANPQARAFRYVYDTFPILQLFSQLYSPTKIFRYPSCRVTTRTLHPLCSKVVKNVALVSIKLA